MKHRRGTLAGGISPTGAHAARQLTAGRTIVPWAIALLVASLALLASCTDTGRTIVAPPRIAGAEFLGSEECAICHDSLVERFATATHAGLEAAGEEVAGIGCESCHGPGSLHAAAGGDRKQIINPRRTPQVCFQCHLDVRADFTLPHSHPVTGGLLALTTGKVSCADCHDFHEGPAVRTGGTAVLSENEACLACHPAQRGPHVFEHEAMLEGCTTCHRPHGSVNEKLLTERNATLCLKCHFQEQTAPGTILIGGRDHSFFLSQGTCWSAGCHEAVHGSQVNSSLRF